MTKKEKELQCFLFTLHFDYAIIVSMKSFKYIVGIILILVTLLSVIMVFSSRYFAWQKKSGYSEARSNKIKLISLIVMTASAIALVVLLSI